MKPDEALQKLSSLLYAFVQGEQTKEQVREIDEILSQSFPSGANFPDKEAYDDLEVAVACFKPGGGQFMYDEVQMAIVCRYVLVRLGKTTL